MKLWATYGAIIIGLIIIKNTSAQFNEGKAMTGNTFSTSHWENEIIPSPTPRCFWVTDSQNNNAIITNIATSSANTGGNSQTGSGGNNTINTGDASASATVVTVVNSKWVCE